MPWHLSGCVPDTSTAVNLRQSSARKRARACTRLPGCPKPGRVCCARGHLDLHQLAARAAHHQEATIPCPVSAGGCAGRTAAPAAAATAAGIAAHQRAEAKRRPLHAAAAAAAGAGASSAAAFAGCAEKKDGAVGCHRGGARAARRNGHHCHGRRMGLERRQQRPAIAAALQYAHAAVTKANSQAARAAASTGAAFRGRQHCHARRGGTKTACL